MAPKRDFFLCWTSFVALAAAGCAAGVSNPQDPPVQTAEGPTGTPPEKKSPDEYWVKLDTSKGDVIIEVHRDWSPYGADRFYELVQSGYYNGSRAHRVITGFVAQMGIAADPNDTAKWKQKTIPDDHPASQQTNARGYVTFAKTPAPNSRTTQFFINTHNNAQLDAMGFTPFGQVLSGMEAIDQFYAGYKEGPGGPKQSRIEMHGNIYLDEEFPKLDSIKKATILPNKPDLTKQAEPPKKP
jgi:peptidyl-prolyl cis-trans isomerase A (cyclophilin A)